MTELNKQNRSFYHCTVFFRELYKRGVRHIVISPGSRSTPLTLAAAAHSGLKKHVILDERSSAFTALGIGKATGIPAVLVCTSGTAAANYYPAVIEAYQSGVPLLLATSDRPPELRNTDANQTIDQIDLFGKFVLYFQDLGASLGDDQDTKLLKDIAGNAIEKATELLGPVHLNFPFGKPLEPEIDFLNSIKKENENFARNTKLEIAETAVSAIKLNDKINDKFKNADRPLIIVGPLPTGTQTEPIFELAKKLNSPVLSEQGFDNAINSIQGYEGLLRNEQMCKQLAPDLILRFGLQPASKSLLLAFDIWKPEHHIYVRHNANKKATSLSVTDTLEWNGGTFIFKESSGRSGLWIDQWKEAEKNYEERKVKILKKVQRLTDGHIYEHLSRQIPDSWWIFFSNSFPARDRSMFGKWSIQKMFSNRGASGIDGITSTAMGISVGERNPGILFTGDLAFLHDTNALLNQKLLTDPLAVVVVNNKGGSIFRMLPIADHKEYFTDYFETPQQADISHLCRGYDINYCRIDTPKRLEEFSLDNFLNRSEKQLNILECITDPDASMQLRRKLWK